MNRDVYWKTSTAKQTGSLRTTSYPIEESSEESGCYDELSELKISDDDLNHQLAAASLKRKVNNSENEPPPAPPRQQLHSRRSSARQDSTGANGGSGVKSAKWLSDSELIFSLTNQVGGLVRALRIFQELDIGIKHVESRKSKRRESEFEIFVDIDCSDSEKMRKLVHHLR